VQSNRMSRFNQVKAIAGGVASGRNIDGLYDKYMTPQAIRRLGA